MPIENPSSFYEISVVNETVLDMIDDGRLQISLSQGEINIIDCLTGDIVASYAEGLSLSQLPQKDENGNPVIYLRKDRLQILNRGF